MRRASSRTVRVLSFLLLPLVVACDDDPSGTGGLDPSDFIGTYVLNPAPSLTCDLGEWGDVVLTVDSIEITDASRTQLDVRVPVRVSNDFTADMTSEAEFTVLFDDESGEFVGGTPIDIDVPVGITTIHGDGAMSLSGEFANSDSFNALISGDVSVSVGSGSSTPCSDLSLSVQGTRD